MRGMRASGRRIAAAGGTALATLAALAAGGAGASAGTAAAAQATLGPQTCVTVQQFSATSAQQAATARYWTLARMRMAAGWSPAANQAPPRLTPAQARDEQPAVPHSSRMRACYATKALLAGVPAVPAASAGGAAVPQSRAVTSGYRTVGKLFFVTSAGRRASCTGTSISNGRSGDLVLTAAHCVAESAAEPTHGWAFAPGWHNGTDPYGLWTGLSVRVDEPGWFRDCAPSGSGTSCQTNPPYDYAVVVIRPRAGHSLAARVGADGWRVDEHYTIGVTIAGFPSGRDSALITTGLSHVIVESAHRYRQAVTPGFSDGTSGGPWFYAYSRRAQLGSILGDIGGYQRGGLHPSPSYSPYWRPVFAALVKSS